MDNVLKQRILGIIVLFALIGICITVLLHNNKNAQHHSNNTSSVTTQQPTITTTETPSTTSVFTNTQKATPVVKAQPLQVQTRETQQQPQPYGGALSSSAATPAAQPASSPTAMQQAVAAQQPQAPAVTAKPKALPAHAAKAKPAPVARVKAVPITKQAAKPMEKTSGGTLGGWGVQVGTFSSRNNAESLVRTLHAKGFSATAQNVRTEKGEMTRVVVGTSGLSREKAEALKTRLSKNLHLTGFLTTQGEKGTSGATIAQHREQPKKHTAAKLATTPVKQTVKVENINSVTIP